MKKKILSLSIIIMAVLSANAQNHIDARSIGDEFTINYNAVLTRPGSDYATITTPMLCGAHDTLRMEPIVVRGKRYSRKLHRTAKLTHTPEADVRYYTVKDMPHDESLTLIISPDSKLDWMRKEPITLCVLTEREGCCKVETLSVETVGPVQYEAPKKVFIPALDIVPDFKGVAGSLLKDNPVLEHISNYRPYDSSRILRKEKGALYVHFPLDKTELRRDFRDNASTLDKIVDITRQIMADSTSRVKCIQIIGLASVEGTQARNSYLGEGRADALKQYVQARVNTPDSLFECVNGGEAWTELRDQINDSDSPYREQMLDIIDNEPTPDRREAKLKALDKGRAYAYLRQNVLSDQRNSGYIHIYFDYVPDSNAATINRASELLRQEKYEEALTLLRTVQDDKRAFNALGVALYMTGQQEEALKCFEAAAAEGNTEAKKNLEQLKVKD